jgi:hypothetical protein
MAYSIFAREVQEGKLAFPLRRRAFGLFSSHVQAG